MKSLIPPQKGAREGANEMTDANACLEERFECDAEVSCL